MSRLPHLQPGELDEDQRGLYEAITSGPRARGPQPFRLTDDEGRLEGPFNAMLLNPTIGDALQGCGAAIRYGGRLSERAREIAILTVAAHWRCDFERRAHEPIASNAGLRDDQLAAIREADPVDLDDVEEALVHQLTRQLLEDRDLDDAVYERAAEVLGADQIFELTTLVGYYSLLALQMRVFRVD